MRSHGHGGAVFRILAAHRFVKDPHEVARVGDTMKVRVLEIDLERRRIALSARPG